MPSRRFKVGPLVAAALALAVLVCAGAAPAGAQPTTKERADAISAKIMSPYCPGYLLIDCPSAEAKQLREIIRRKVIAGDSDEAILEYLVELEGPEVLAEPPKKGFNLLVWSLPFVALIIGGISVVLITGGWTQRRAASKESGDPESGKTTSSGPTEAVLQSRMQRELDEFEY